MIWNFVCIKCKKFKSHGKPNKKGQYICLDCYYKLNEVKGGCI